MVWAAFILFYLVTMTGVYLSGYQIGYHDAEKVSLIKSLTKGSN